MTSPHHATDFLHDLRLRSAAEGGVFWIDDKRLAIFEPAAARTVSNANWRGFVMPDRLVDVVRRRHSREIRWTRVRAAWLAQLHRLTTAEQTASMIERMAAVIDERLGDDVDLVMLGQDVAVRSMLPVALAGVTPREEAQLLRDLDQKLRRLIDRSPGHGLWHRLHFIAGQIRAGVIIRRVLRDRASGKRPRELDLADPFVDLLPELGMDRALDIVGAVLTAIGGPPGSAATSVLYELVRNPDWARRLTTELSAADPSDFTIKAAPVTHRFVKEVLRMWSPPLLLVRHARFPFDLGDTRLAKGNDYVMSPHVIHRDHRIWQQADTFDPDRFLPGATHGPADRGHYVPFGWAPKRCVGADIGTLQLMALCYLVCTRYRLTVEDPGSIVMTYRFAPVPQRFEGRLTPRTGSLPDPSAA
jgi:cytochrome P450